MIFKSLLLHGLRIDGNTGDAVLFNTSSFSLVILSVFLLSTVNSWTVERIKGIFQLRDQGVQVLR